MRGVVGIMCGPLTHDASYVCCCVFVCLLGNKVGDEGATALAEAWKRCPELRDVNLESEWCIGLCDA